VAGRLERLLQLVQTRIADMSWHLPLQLIMVDAKHLNAQIWMIVRTNVLCVLHVWDLIFCR